MDGRDAGPDWEGFRLALMLDRAGSFAAAARAEQVDETTLARRLKRVEARLGARLFDRVEGRLRPTEAGAAVLAQALVMERAAEQAARDLGAGDAAPTGRVRLTAVPMLVGRVLAPALPAFSTQYPGLGLDLIAEPRTLSLARREADIALRLSRPGGEARPLARRLADLAYAPYGLAGGEALPLIAFEDGHGDLPQQAWIDASGAAVAPHRASDAEGQIALALTGLGRVLLPDAVGARVPGLARLGDLEPPLSRELWLLVHPDLRDQARIRAVLDWLAGLFR